MSKGGWERVKKHFGAIGVFYRRRKQRREEADRLRPKSEKELERMLWPPMSSESDAVITSIRPSYFYGRFVTYESQDETQTLYGSTIALNTMASMQRALNEYGRRMVNELERPEMPLPGMFVLPPQPLPRPEPEEMLGYDDIDVSL